MSSKGSSSPAAAEGHSTSSSCSTGSCERSVCRSGTSSSTGSCQMADANGSRPLARRLTVLLLDCPEPRLLLARPDRNELFIVDRFGLIFNHRRSRFDGNFEQGGRFERFYLPLFFRFFRDDGGKFAAAFAEPAFANGMRGQRACADLERIEQLGNMLVAGEHQQLKSASGKTVAYRQAAAKLDERRKQLDAQLGALIEQSPLESWTAQGELKLAWVDLSVDEQRAILAAVYPRIVIQRAAVRGARFDSSRIVLG